MFIDKYALLFIIVLCGVHNFCKCFLNKILYVVSLYPFVNVVKNVMF